MRTFLTFSFLLLVGGGAACGAESAPALRVNSAQELINPLTRSFRLAFTLNSDRGIGPENKGEELTLLNTRLVFPFRLNPEWHMVTRTTFRYFNLKDVPMAGEDTEGLSDTVTSLYITPAKLRRGLLWGIGPTLLLPTATDELLGTEKWGIVPTAAVVGLIGPWVCQLIASHTWSVAGSDKRQDVRLTRIESAIVYTFWQDWNAFADSTSVYNWEADNFLIPLNIGVGRRFQIREVPVLVSGAGRYWIERPETGPEGFGFRLSVVLQLPKGD